MAEAFGTMKVTHRASDDVDALCGMWRILLLGLRSAPPVLCKLASMHDSVEWTLGQSSRVVANEGEEAVRVSQKMQQVPNLQMQRSQARFLLRTFAPQLVANT